MTESTEPDGATALQVRRILLPTDFSGCANYALPYAAAIARAVGATVICVNVVEPIVPAVGYTGMAEAMPIAEMSEQMEESAEREEPAVMSCEELRGLKVEEVIGHGDAAEIVRAPTNKTLI
jgi:nucleotide-binding universal stress UspA family protein